MGYDGWLERPYIKRGEDAEDFYAFCERTGRSPADTDAEDAYFDWVDDPEERLTPRERELMHERGL